MDTASLPESSPSMHLLSCLSAQKPHAWLWWNRTVTKYETGKIKTHTLLSQLTN